MSNSIYPVLPGVTFDWLRAPRWNTTVQVALSGKSTAISYQLYPLIHFELNYDILQDRTAPSDIKALVGFFNSLQAGYDTFLFTDPDFNTFPSVLAQPFGTGDGSNKIFQLTAFYGNPGGEGYPEIVQNLNGTPVLYSNGTVISSGYTIGATGIVTFTTAPVVNAALTWSGSFYYRCAFDDDQLDIVKIMSGTWDGKGIKFTEVIL